MKRIMTLAVATLMMFSFLAESCFAKTFSDIHEDGQPFLYESVDYLSDNEILSGYDDGTFKPDKNITRAEASKILANSLGFEDDYEGEELPFTDVPKDQWFYKYVAYAYEKEIINGMSPKEFWPQDNVTYEQFVKMVVCAIGEEYEALERGGTNWYTGYLELAEEKGLLEGVTVRVKEKATRGDCAKILYNAYKNDYLVPVSYTSFEQPFEDEFFDEEEIEEFVEEVGEYEFETIVIDPGHNYSGIDTGAENLEFDAYEQEITWEIADKLREILEDNGYEVIMTREEMEDNIDGEEVMEVLLNRAELANELDADLFISIHVNAGGGTGIETYAYRDKTYAYAIGEFVQAAMVEHTGLKDRGIKTNDYVVLMETDMPAMLIETGFIDREEDCEYLMSVDGQYEIAWGIAQGLEDYRNSFIGGL